MRHSRRIEQQVHRPVETTSANHSDSPVDPLRITESQSVRSLRVRQPRTTSHVDNDSDPDDDTPLHRLVTDTPSRVSNRPSRQNPRYSDEHISQSQPTGSSGSMATPSSSLRALRTQKRPHYLDDDTDEEDGQRLAKRPTNHGRYAF